MKTQWQWTLNLQLVRPGNGGFFLRAASVSAALRNNGWELLAVLPYLVSIRAVTYFVL